MIYNVKFTVPNNHLHVKRLLTHTGHNYSNMSLGIVGYHFDYDLGPRSFGGYKLDEIERSLYM